MLFPTLSVTGIGLIAGLILVVVYRSQPVRALLLGAGGAWAGFITGAGCGLVVDVAAQTGVFVFIVGHLMAVAGSVAALFWFRK